jgi:diacylglycerol kinase (ATP)
MTYTLIYNPKAGKGKIVSHLAFIESFFKSKNIAFIAHETKDKDDAKVFLDTLTPPFRVLIAGGDGTISTILNALMHIEPRPDFAVLPYGSANDISHIFGFSKNIKKTLNLIVESEAVKIDVNQLNDTYFLYTAAAGLFTRISYDISRENLSQYGQIAYYIEGIKDLTQNYSFDLTIKDDHKTIRDHFVLVLGLAANRVGGIPLNFLKANKLNDGLFELYLFEQRNILSKVNVLSFFARQGRPLKTDRILKSSSFEIKASKDVKWNADGELVTSGNIRIQVLKEAIGVFVSTKAKKKFF